MNDSWLSKEEFANKKKEERSALYNKANEQLQVATSDASSFLHYLKLQATIGYDVTNTLLVMCTNPNATWLKDYARWKELNAVPLKAQKGIKIIRPTPKKDGNGVNYITVTVFDVSQTNYQNDVPTPPSKDELLAALPYKTGIRIEYLDNTSHLSKSVFYDKNENIIYIQKGLPVEDSIRGLMREYVLMENSSPTSLLKGERFEICCVLYMLSCKYGIDPINTKFALECADYFKNKDIKVKKQILKNIKSVYDGFYKRINEGLYSLKNEMEGMNS